MDRETETVTSDPSNLDPSEKLDKDESTIENLDKNDISEISGDVKDDSTETLSVDDLEIDEVTSDKKDDSSETEIEPQRDLQKESADESSENEFISLDDTDVEIESVESTKEGTTNDLRDKSADVHLSDELSLDDKLDDGENHVEALPDKENKKDEPITNDEVSETEIQPHGDQLKESSDETDENEIISLEEADVEFEPSESIKPAANSDLQAESTEVPPEDNLSVDENSIKSENPVEALSDKDIKKDGSSLDDTAFELEIEPQGDQQKEPSDKTDENEFFSLDETEVGDQSAKLTKPLPEVDPKENPKSGEFTNISSESETKKIKDQNESSLVKQSSKLTEENPKIEKSTKGLSLSKKIVSLVVLVLAIAGIVIYSKPVLIGSKKESKPTPRQTSEKTKSVLSQQEKTVQLTYFEKSDIYAAKLEDLGRLIDELLVKKEEIAKLKSYFLNRNDELESRIIEEMQKRGITLYSQAIDNKFIELSLRTIQRRHTYIRELEKPAQWVDRGIEELLYLKRKVQVDLEMIDVAGGIDWEGHIQRINAAIQKFQPNAENLRVLLSDAEKQTLETVWHQISDRQNKIGQRSLKSTNDYILKEICFGNFTRVTELTSLSPKAAQCLSHLKGTDLVLNGLKKLSPLEAKYLFSWRGNWICLNGLKELSPTVA